MTVILQVYLDDRRGFGRYQIEIPCVSTDKAVAFIHNCIDRGYVRHVQSGDETFYMMRDVHMFIIKQERSQEKLIAFPAINEAKIHIENW